MGKKILNVVPFLFMLLWLPGQASAVSLEEIQALMVESDKLAQEQSNVDMVASPEFGLPEMVLPKRVLIDVRTTHSDGLHEMPILIDWAKKRGIESMAFTEHDRYSIRFGIDPIPQILGYSQQHPSLYVTGVEEFFLDLQRQRNMNSDIALFAGTESTPGYYWSGVPFRNLTLHEAERHLITLGIETPEQVEALSSYDLRHGYGNKAISLAFWVGIIFLFIMVLLRRRKRAVALLLMASLVAFLSTWLMQKKPNPELDFIDSARAQGLFVIWTHPGTLSGVRPGPMGIKLDTPPYNDKVFEVPTADAFAAIYGDTDQNSVAGGLWDRHMMAYLRGYHDKPIWAVAAGDYHEQGMANEYLGNYPMDVWSDSPEFESVLKALRQGHMVAWGMDKDQNISIKALYLEDLDGTRLLPGDEAEVKGRLRLVAALTERVASPHPVRLNADWIVDGHVVGQVSLDVASEQAAVLPITLSRGVHVVRLQINQGVRMVANPFLLHVQ